jgi:hypothetical protein
MESNMTRIFATLASVAIMGLSLTVGHAAEAPLPPRINFMATPASNLHLGMTADDVNRVMGKAAQETNFELDSIQMRKLEFTDPIPGEVILSDGKLSRVTLDPFRMQGASLPSFIRQAWPGLASSAVRRALGDPAVVLRHSFSGIEVDQWIYSRAGGTDASVFFRSDRLIGRSVGRDIPGDLFRVDLPSSPLGESEGPISAPRLGTTAHDIEETYGAPKYRVDYVRNGQPASREIYEIGKTEFFVAFTVVDGVVIELENLGRTPNDPSFQGL